MNNLNININKDSKYNIGKIFKIDMNLLPNINEDGKITPQQKNLEKELKRIIKSIPQNEELQEVRRVSIKELIEDGELDKETVKETFNNGVKDVIVVWTTYNIHESNFIHGVPTNRTYIDKLYFVTELKNIKTNIESSWGVWNGPFFTRDLKQQKEFVKNFYIREEGYNKYNVSSNNGTELFMDGNKLVNISK